MKAVIYTRVSSTTERQNTERQVADLKAYAEYRKLEITGIFEEKISGAKKTQSVLFWLRLWNTAKQTQ